MKPAIKSVVVQLRLTKAEQRLIAGRKQRGESLGQCLRRLSVMKAVELMEKNCG